MNSELECNKDNYLSEDSALLGSDIHFSSCVLQDNGKRIKANTMHIHITYIYEITPYKAPSKTKQMDLGAIGSYKNK